MNSEHDKPTVRAPGLVTLAYLRARLDHGQDHLGIFMPLLIDVLPQLPNQHFTSVEVQDAIATTHGVRIPQNAVATLLSRAKHDRLLLREHGRFQISDRPLPKPNISGHKARLSEAQERFAQALVSHSKSRGLPIDSVDSALDLTLRFITEQQISLLLENSTHPIETSWIPAQHSMMAEFIHDVALSDPALNTVLRTIIQGLVLYYAAFLADLTSIERKFKNLSVVFDSGLVRQLLGYEGTSAQTLMTETVDLFRASGIRCIMFDKSAHEIQRILSMFQVKLATHTGRRSLRPTPMARHFLTCRYSPSDVQEMSALLESRIRDASIQIVPAPEHRKELTHREPALAKRLADPCTRDLYEPRVLHDVDCVAGVLTSRRGHRTNNIEDARYVFATASPLVVRNVKRWWKEDERETGVSPVVNVRLLANLAWLKNPTASVDLQLHELVALCAAAMRPSEQTWERFLSHLDKLHTSQRLSEHEIGAIIASAVADQSLRDAELAHEDGDDFDSGTLDEAIERVSSDYRAEADARVRTVSEQYEQKVACDGVAADERLRAARSAADTNSQELRRRDRESERRAKAIARWIVGIPYWLLSSTVVAGSVALALTYSVTGGWIDVVIGGAVFLVMSLELIGVLHHLRAARSSVRDWLKRRLANWLKGNRSTPPGTD